MIPTRAAVQRACQAGAVSSTVTFREERRSQFKKECNPTDEPDQAEDARGDAIPVDVNLGDDAVEIEGPSQRQRDQQVGRECQAQAAQEQDHDDQGERPAEPSSHGPAAPGVVAAFRLAVDVSCVFVMVLIALMGSFFSVPSVSRVQRSGPKRPGS